MKQEIQDIVNYLGSLDDLEQVRVCKGVLKLMEKLLRIGWLMTKHPFHNELTSHPKGYLKFSSLLSLKQFNTGLDDLGLRKVEIRQFMEMSDVLFKMVRVGSKELYSNPTSVRLLCPPTQIIQEVLFEIPPPGLHQMFELKIAQMVTVLKVQYDEDNFIAVVETNEPEILRALDGESLKGDSGSEKESRSIILKVVERQEVEKWAQFSKNQYPQTNRKVPESLKLIPRLRLSASMLTSGVEQKSTENKYSLQYTVKTKMEESSSKYERDSNQEDEIDDD